MLGHRENPLHMPLAKGDVATRRILSSAQVCCTFLVSVEQVPTKNTCTESCTVFATGCLRAV